MDKKLERAMETLEQAAMIIDKLSGCIINIEEHNMLYGESLAWLVLWRDQVEGTVEMEVCNDSDG